MRSTFDERLQPGQRLIPLLGDKIKVLLYPFHRPRIEFKSALSSGTDAVHDFCPLQHSKVLGDCLASKLGTLS